MKEDMPLKEKDKSNRTVDLDKPDNFLCVVASVSLINIDGKAVIMYVYLEILAYI